MTNVDDIVQSLTILPGNVTSVQSDHFTIKFEISEQAPNNKVTGETRYVFNYYNKGNYKEMSTYLSNSEMNTIFSLNDTELIWQIIRSSILRAIDMFIPIRKKKVNKSPVWLTGEIRHKLNCVRCLRRNLRSKFTISKLNQLQAAEDELNKTIVSYC